MLLCELRDPFIKYIKLNILHNLCVSLAAPVISMMTYMAEFTKQSLRPRVLNLLSYGLGISFILVPGKRKIVFYLQTN